MKYRVTYYETTFSTVEIEADSPEEAHERFMEKWEEDEEFVEDILDRSEFLLSKLEIE